MTIQNKAIIGASIFFIFSFFALPVYSAIDISYDIDSSFSVGDTIAFNYTIVSDKDISAKTVAYIVCPSAPIEPLLEKPIELLANVPYNGSYIGLTITEDLFVAEECIAKVMINEPEQYVVEKLFNIDVLPRFSFFIAISSTVLALNQKINIDYESEIENPDISAYIILPDGEKEDIQLPLLYAPKETGDYEVVAVAKKQKFYQAEDKRIFSVIQEFPKVNIISKDVAESKNDNFGISWRIVIIVFGIIIVFAVLIGSFLYFRTKDDKYDGQI